MFLFSSFISITFFKKPLMVGVLQWMGFSVPLLALYTLYAYAFQGLKSVVLCVAIKHFCAFVNYYNYFINTSTTSQQVAWYFLPHRLLQWFAVLYFGAVLYLHQPTVVIAKLCQIRWV